MRTPLDALSVGDALEQHYRAHGLAPDGGANDTTFVVRIGPLNLRLPNPPARRRVVMLHDVNHLVTGYDTVYSRGEMEIAAFEIGAGCGPFPIVWYLDLSTMGMGVLFSPIITFRGFVRGRRSGSIYHHPPPLPTLKSVTVGDVRAQFHIVDGDITPTLGDRVAFSLWSVPALLVAAIPSLLALGAAYLIYRIAT